MNMNFEQRVKIAAYIQHKTLRDMAKEFGVTQSAFLSRCKKGKLNFNEQRKVAEILGCNIIIKFVFDDGSEYTANTVKTLVMDACAHVDMTQAELGKRLGKSRQTFNSKLNNGRFTDDELLEVASKIGCTYHNYFEMEDGSQI